MFRVAHLLEKASQAADTEEREIWIDLAAQWMAKLYLERKVGGH